MPVTDSQVAYSVCPPVYNKKKLYMCSICIEAIRGDVLLLLIYNLLFYQL